MKIIKATKKDLGKIADLYHEYDKYEHNLDKSVELCSRKMVKKSEERWMNFGTKYILVKENEKIVGALNFDIDLRGKEKIGVLHTLIITKDARGKGYGTQLVKYLLDYFKQKSCSRVRTFIHLNNKDAFSFWKKLGFETSVGYVATRTLK